MKKKKEKKVLISGIRPTGKLHLGHYFGVLKNWLKFQDAEQYECYFFIADWHSLTTKFGFQETGQLSENILEVLKDFLACGINPEKSCLYLQSDLPEIAELSLLLGMITQQSWVEKDPTLKDLVRSLDKSREENQTLSYGMLGYPILQAADILIMNGELVPVGKDQEAHLEISRKISKRFNFLYQTDFFREPQALFTEDPKIKGTDGEKMSKSLNNDLKISETEKETLKKVKTMITDPKRIKKTDPGNPNNCKAVFYFYQAFLKQGNLAQKERLNQVSEKCEKALRGCMDCKKELAGIISNELLFEIRAKREKLNQISNKELKEILRRGKNKARLRAKENLSKIKQIMNLEL